MDVTQSASVLGKDPGSDLRERKPSVVNTLWLQQGSELARIWFGNGAVPIDKLPAIVEEIKANGVIQESHKLCDKYIERARHTLGETGLNNKENQWASMLYMLLETIVKRNF